MNGNNGRRKLNSEQKINFSIGQVSFNLISINYEPPRYPWHEKNHCHSSYEVHFVPSGYGTLQVGAQKYDIAPGTLYLTGPGVYHEQNSCQTDPMEEYGFTFEILSHKHGGTASASDEGGKCVGILTEHPFWFGEDSFQGYTICRKIIEEIEQEALGRAVIIQCFLKVMVIQLVRAISPLSRDPQPLPNKDLNEKRRALMDAFFLGYAYEWCTAERLADRLGVGVRQLNRIMKDYYGMSFQQKLIQVRLEQAKYLLINTNKMIGEVAEEVGYQSLPYFFKLFQMHENCSPAQYRRKNRASE